MGFVIGLLWFIAFGLLAGAVSLPTALDIYVSDRYFVISKRFLVAVILVVVVLPAVALTISRLRSAIH